jgi:hypothetical protein
LITFFSALGKQRHDMNRTALQCLKFSCQNTNNIVQTYQPSKPKKVNKRPDRAEAHWLSSSEILYVELERQTIRAQTDIRAPYEIA